MSLRLETLAIGDELLTGKISDTNSTFVARELFSKGFVLQRQTVIPDIKERIKEELNASAARSDFVIVFGGLGPTSDDLTVDCVGELIGTSAVVHEPAKERLEGLYTKRGREITADALRQVRYPQSATVFENHVGLAPGFHTRIGECTVFFLPGVPDEMRPMVIDSVVPKISEFAGQSGKILNHGWRCIGIPESAVQGLMNPIEASLPKNMWIGYRTSYPENQVILYCRDSGESENTFVAESDRIRKTLKEFCYTETKNSLEETVIELLEKKGLKLALVESCTGGLTVHRLTRVPGSSNVIWGGYTSYQIDAKTRMLGVKLKSDLSAVSAQCSRDLASKALELSGCDMAAAITGYMGPEGGTESDPIGTVYTAVANRETVREKRTVLHRRERERKQWGASAVLLDEIRQLIIR